MHGGEGEHSLDARDTAAELSGTIHGTTLCHAQPQKTAPSPAPAIKQRKVWLPCSRLLALQCRCENSDFTKSVTLDIKWKILRLAAPIHQDSAYTQSANTW